MSAKQHHGNISNVQSALPPVLLGWHVYWTRAESKLLRTLFMIVLEVGIL